MEKTVIFEPLQPPIRNPETDLFTRWFDFSVFDSVGTPQERSSKHSLKITLTAALRNKWGLETPRGSDFSPDLLKVVSQLAEDYITEQIKNGSLQRDLEYSLEARTSEGCPYSNLTNIGYPNKSSFTVTVDKP
jgi:hypothetical protein